MNPPELGIEGIDHVAVAVEDVDAALEVFRRVLGLEASHRETIDAYGVETATLRVGATAVELVAGTRDDAPVARFVRERGPGIHHIAFAVRDVAAAAAAVTARGGRMIDARPRPGKEGSRVAFVHPRSTGRVLVELVQPRADQDP